MITANEIISKLQSGELESPAILSDYIVILSSKLSQIGNMELEAEIAYSKKWSELKDNCKTDKVCDMQAKLTPEYKEWKRAVIANKTILETIRSLKKKLTNLEGELRSGQNY